MVINEEMNLDQKQFSNALNFVINYAKENQTPIVFLFKSSGCCAICNRMTSVESENVFFNKEENIIRIDGNEIFEEIKPYEDLNCNFDKLYASPFFEDDTMFGVSVRSSVENNYLFILTYKKMDKDFSFEIEDGFIN